MADKVLSIEIGYSLTKACEVERAKTPKILNSVTITTPENTISDGMVNETENFVTAFKEGLSEKKIRTKKAIFTVSSTRIVTKEVTIPFVKENKIKDVVRANLSEYFPVDPTQYVFSHSVIGVVHENANGSVPQAEQHLDPKIEAAMAEDEEENPKAKKKAKAKAEPKPNLGKATGYRLMVLAAPKVLINGYEKLAKSLGLELESIDYNGNSIYQAAKDECKEGVELIIKIDERSSLLMVLDNGSIAFNRTIPYGIDEAIGALRYTKELGYVDTYENALELARRKTVILSNFKGEILATDSSDHESEEIFAEKKMVTDSFSTLAGGILRVIDYYNSNHRDRHIQKAYLTGIGADFSGISTLLSNELDLKVRNLTHLSVLDMKKVFSDASFGEFVSVIGAVMAPLSFYPDHDDNNKKGKGSSTSNTNTLLIALLVLGLCLIGSGVMVAMTLIPYKQEEAKNKSYKETIDRLQPSYDIYQQYLVSENNVKYIRHIEKSGVNRNEQMVEFFTYMENELPYSFCLTSITSDTETITLDCTVKSKEEVAYTLDKLKKCDIFSFADITSVSLIENELGEILYGFTVDLSYAPILTEEEAEEAEEVE